MTIIEKALKDFPRTSPEDWRQVGRSAVHKDCTIGNRAIFLGTAICRGGTILGGTIWGGTIEGGTIEGGYIWGGTIRGGMIWGGTIRGGMIWGGMIEGGTIEGGYIWGGMIWGGTILGGTIWGGTIRGGMILGGTIRQTPLQIFGACNWNVVVSKPGHVSVGCECHTPEYWREHIDDIARKHSVDDAEKARVMRCVEMAAKWLEENPDAVVDEVAEGGGE
jgi:hypothetical protein